jgi:hypothetical protein
MRMLGMNDAPKIREKPEEQLERPKDLLSERQVAKLNLEIESLRKKNKWESWSPLIPLFASGVTVIALVLGFLEFQSQQDQQQNKLISEQQQDRTTRLQNQLRSDVDEILGPQDKSQTVSRVSFLLEDINIVMASPIKDKDKDRVFSDVFQSYKRTFTESLVDRIVNDADFVKNPKDVIFATKTAEHWEDYRNYLKETPHLAKLDHILNRYVLALLSLRQTNASYMNGLDYDENQSAYIPPNEPEKKDREENLFQQFIQIQNGFTEHLELTKDDSRPEAQRIRQLNLRDFEVALCNRKIAQHILGPDFADKPCQK